MVNFYNYIHATLNESQDNELIFWPGLDGSRGLSNRNLLQHISNFRHLLQLHAAPGAPVLLAIPASVDSINALLAIQSIGAVPVIPPAKAGIKVLLSTIKKQHIKVIIAAKKPGVLLHLILKLIGLKYLYVNHTVKRSMTWQPEQVPPDQPALITYSSGTTGEPKGIFRSHQVFSAQHLLIKKLFPADKGSRDFPLFPNVILHNLASGLVSILPDIPGFQMVSLDPARVIAQLESQQVARLSGNVFYLKSLINFLKGSIRSFASVKTVVIGGSPVPLDLVHALRPYFPHAAFYIIYGSSEAEPIAIRQVDTLPEDPLNGYAVGIPCKELEFRISRPVVIHTSSGSFNAGEIEVKGKHVATTKEGGWLNTGDIGYLTPDGQLYLTARIGNEKPHQGIQHFQIEHLLVLQPGVQQAAAISDSDGFKILVQGQLGKEEVQQILSAHFSPGIIKSIELVAQIPVDNRHHSKVLYHKLK
ncbi:MAG TPA: AMP-binding protein [Pedobacter sp.]|uniref:AMP-binding protein n=1 Tax=Pedobacter sp. TaxID=1411316 RepID=UPI002D1A44D3|nr:AMP-binding protein [Pedobacter sp.]HMI04705.1 AMP-binding protein [Pedobacter sp.]